MPQTADQVRTESPEAARELLELGASQERARIQGIENASFPGHEALIAGMKFDGKTSPGDAALAVMAAERKARGTAALALAEDAPAPVKTTAAVAIEEPVKSKAEMAAEATLLSAKENIGFLAAFKKLGFDKVPA